MWLDSGRAGIARCREKGQECRSKDRCERDPGRRSVRKRKTDRHADRARDQYGATPATDNRIERAGRMGTRNDLVFLSALQIRYPRLPEEKLNTAARLFDMAGHAADRGVVASRESRCAVAAFAGHALDECALWLDRPAQSQDRDSR